MESKAAEVRWGCAPCVKSSRPRLHRRPHTQTCARTHTHTYTHTHTHTHTRLLAPQASCKSVFVLQLLLELAAKGHRTLVFSQSRVMLDILQVGRSDHTQRQVRRARCTAAGCAWGHLRTTPHHLPPPHPDQPHPRILHTQSMHPPSSLIPHTVVRRRAFRAAA